MTSDSTNDADHDANKDSTIEATDDAATESTANSSKVETENSKASPGLPPGRLGRLRRLCQKELREILRDRRTVVTLVLMPLLVYPLLSLVFQRFLLTTASSIGPTVSGIIVGVESEEAWDAVEEYILLGHRLLESRDTIDIERPEINPAIVTNLTTPLREQRIDLSIRVTFLDETPPLFGPPRAEFEILHRKGSAISESALRFFVDRFRAVNDEYMARKLRDLEVSIEPPLKLVRLPTEATSKPSFSLVSLIPLVLILMTITGAVYPAIDLTAGERERGTLEALIAAPVPRSDLLLAKYVAVVAVAMLTAAANLIGMGVTLSSTGLGEQLFPTSSLPSTLFLVFGLLVLFALFFSAVLLAVTSFARSFKEAQAYLIPLMLVSLAPGIVSLSPGIELKGLIAFTPLVNIVLLARDLFAGNAALAPAMAAILSTIIYAAIAIVIAARIFGSDTALYGSDGTWSDWLQRPPIVSSEAQLGTAIICVMILLSLYIICINLLGKVAGSANIGTIMALSSCVTILLFGIVPVCFALINRIRLSTSFHIQPATTLAFLAAGLLGFSLWPLAHEIFLAQRKFMPNLLDETKLEGAQAMIEAWRNLPWAVPFIAIAIIPAIFEELFFRGFLFSSLLKNTSKQNAIIGSAVLFGAFHVISTALKVERFLPSTFMGLILAWVCLRTGSIFPGMLLHACHNGLLATMGYFEDWLTANNIGTQIQEHLPTYWLTCAVIGTIVGLLVIRFFVTKFESIENDSVVT